MKIVFITQKEDIHSSIILEELLKSSVIKVVGVVTSKTIVHKRNLFKSLFYIYKKSGLLYVLMRVFESIYVKNYRFFRLLGRDKFKGENIKSVLDIINEHKLFHLNTENINNEESLGILSKLKPDVMVSCVFNQIYSKELMRIAPKGIINIHRSYLPYYKGISPTFWVLANKERFTGVSAHFVTATVDEGPILLQKKLNITDKDTIHTLSKRLMEAIKKDFIQELILYVNNKRKPFKFSKGGAYYSWPDRKAVIRFLRNRRKIF